MWNITKSWNGCIYSIKAVKFVHFDVVNNTRAFFLCACIVSQKNTNTVCSNIMSPKKIYVCSLNIRRIFGDFCPSHVIYMRVVSMYGNSANIILHCLHIDRYSVYMFLSNIVAYNFFICRVWSHRVLYLVSTQEQQNTKKNYMNSNEFGYTSLYGWIRYHINKDKTTTKKILFPSLRMW